MTALVILCSGIPIGFGADAGAELTISGFTATYGTGSPSLLRLRYVALHFQPLSDGDYMELVVLSFYSLLRLLNLLCLVYSLVCDPWCYCRPWNALEYRRNIQRSDGDSEPYRTFPSFRYGSETVEGFF